MIFLIKPFPRISFFVLAGTTSKFSFGNLATANIVSTSVSDNSFSSPNMNFSFGSLKTGAAANVTSSTNNAIPKLDSKEFGFVFKPKSPMKTTIDDTVEDVSDDENVEEEENTTYFTPVIPLPEKIEVKTGEEDEDILYSHRAKLYRFRSSEWRERGLGDVKILQHKTSGRLR